MAVYLFVSFLHTPYHHTIPHPFTYPSTASTYALHQMRWPLVLSRFSLCCQTFVKRARSEGPVSFFLCSPTHCRWIPWLQVIGGERSDHLIPVPLSSAPTDQAVSEMSSIISCCPHFKIPFDIDSTLKGDEYEKVLKRNNRRWPMTWTLCRVVVCYGTCLFRRVVALTFFSCMAIFLASTLSIGLLFIGYCISILRNSVSSVSFLLFLPTFQLHSLLLLSVVAVDLQLSTFTNVYRQRCEQAKISSNTCCVHIVFSTIDVMSWWVHIVVLLCISVTFY